MSSSSSCSLCGYKVTRNPPPYNNGAENSPCANPLIEVIATPDRVRITYQCPSCSMRRVGEVVLRAGNVDRIKLILEGMVRDLIGRIREIKNKKGEEQDAREMQMRIRRRSRSPYEASESNKSPTPDDNQLIEEELKVEVKVEEVEDTDYEYLLDQGVLIDGGCGEKDHLHVKEEEGINSNDTHCVEQIPLSISSAEGEEIGDTEDPLWFPDPDGRTVTDGDPVENSQVVVAGPSRRIKRFTCSYVDCGKKYYTRSQYMLHARRAHSDERNWECCECGKAFKDKYLRNTHIRNIHTDRKSFKCPECPEVEFKGKNGLERHLISVHQLREWPFICHFPGCEKGFLQKCKLKTHQDFHHRIGKRVCPREGCGKEFNNQANFDSHLKIHKKGLESLKCPKCPKEFYSFGCLRKHENSHLKKFPCPVSGCGKIFGTRWHLKVHAEVHCKERNYLCDKCGKAFKTLTSKYIHMRGVHREELFKCTDCPDVSFKTKHGLDRHFCSTHGKEWPFYCPIVGCGKGFLILSNLNHHKDKWHTESHNCPHVGCGKVFSSQRFLKSHEKLHEEGIESLKCEKCGREYDNYISFNNHLYHHRHPEKEIKRLPCPHCSRMFKSKAVQEDHINRHEGIKKYQCEICRRSFSSSGNLRTHEKHVHEQGGKPRPSRVGGLAKTRVENQNV